jgi:hypothetical protein
MAAARYYRVGSIPGVYYYGSYKMTRNAAHQCANTLHHAMATCDDFRIALGHNPRPPRCPTINVAR